MSNCLGFSRLDQTREVFERTVVAYLGIGWKTAGRQLPAGQMKTDAFAAGSLARAGFITAIALRKVLGLFAFHESLLQVGWH